MEGSPAPGVPSPGADGVIAVEHDLPGALHEVSNALTVILGWVERAREAREDELARALDIVAGRARDARRIVRRAIGAAVPSGDGGEIGPASLRREVARTLGEVVEDAVTALDPEACRASVTVTAELDPTLAARPVHAGAPLIQILTNLLLNAIAMSPHGGAVRVDACLEDGCAVLGVSDEGPGIPPERRATLLRSGVSTRVGGAGIGLRHSAALAEATGGRLTLAPSERGARFELRWPLDRDGDGAHYAATPVPSTRRLPLWDAVSDPPPSTSRIDASLGAHPASLFHVTGAAAPPGAAAAASVAFSDGPPSSAPARPSGPVLEGVRILIVEDDDAVVDLLDTALTARGATIVSVRHVRELPDALATGPFHAALLDLSPIVQDVGGTVAAVQGASPGARLVMMSGSGTIADLPGDCGACWVRKPFEVGEIVDALIR